MLMCTKRGGCQKLDGHGGWCGRWSLERGEYVPLDTPPEHPAPAPIRQAMVLEFADGRLIPTGENLARFIAERVQGGLGAAARVTRVVVAEDSTLSTTYEPD